MGLKSNQIEIFNKTFIDFFDNLSVYNCENANFSTFKNLAQAYMCVDTYSIYNLFHQTVFIKYENQIINKDANFFLAQDSYDKEYDDIDFISAVKTIWQKIDKESQENIWKFLNVLVYLDKQIDKQL